jgi:mannose-6-phosphate isomerase
MARATMVPSTLSIDSPLRFEHRPQPRLWGGSLLGRELGIAAAPGAADPIGEVWEIVDRPDENSRVLAEPGEPHGGRTLRALMEQDARALLGRAPGTAEGRFPVLVKYIDSGQELSVQVHPDDAGAAALRSGERLDPNAEAKTEAWYVLAAEPGARLWCGLKPGVAPRDLERAAGSAAVVDLLDEWPVRVGECVVVPGGTVHAIGRGVLILEIQQNSDTTYRIWDWGRVDPKTGRERRVHLREALASASFGAPRRPPLDPVAERSRDGLARAPLARTKHFALNRLQISAPLRLSTMNQWQVYAVTRGAGTIAPHCGTGGGAQDRPARRLERGQVWLLPAALGYHAVEPDAGGLELVQTLWRA